MKKLISMLLILLLSFNISFAETSEFREMTSDEQAYNIYLDIAYVYEYGVRYLEEMERIWDIVLSTKSVEEINKLCYFDCLSQESLMSLYSMLISKYGYSEDELRQLSFSSDVFSVSEKTELIWVVLGLGEASGYLSSPSKLKGYLDRAFGNIRTLMANDKEYVFLSELKEYYKDATMLYEYIADFNDNYTGFSVKLDSFNTSKSSWEIDFEFIFDPAGYSYVSEVRTAQQNKENKKVYDQATILEANGDYEGAIELYWECRWYEDALKRIEVCNESIANAELHNQYASAVSYQESGDYSNAYKIFNSLGDYLDSSSRAAECFPHLPLASAQFTRYKSDGEDVNSYSIIFNCDSAGNIIFKKINHATFPTETTYVYENGKLVNSTESGIASYTGIEIDATYTKQCTHNEYGDPITEHYQVTSVLLKKVTIDTTKTISYIYDAYGKKINEITSTNSATYEYENDKVVKQSRFLSDGKLYCATVYEYDEFGRILRETCTYYQGLEGYYDVTEYIYE